MAWSASKIFTSTLEDILENTTAIDLNSSAFNIALFSDAITPAQDAASAATAFGAGVWASGEVFDGTEWATGGQALDTVTFTQTGGTALKWDAANEVSSGTSASLSFYGTLIYCTDVNTPVDSQGVCYLYAGGNVAVVDGTLTLVFHDTNGIFTITL